MWDCLGVSASPGNIWEHERESGSALLAACCAPCANSFDVSVPKRRDEKRTHFFVIVYRAILHSNPRS
jgi:hypothetical protein